MDCDVVVVGACTAGTYFAGLLARAGLRVLVIDGDAEEELAARLDIAHFDRDLYEVFGVEQPRPGDEDFVHDFDASCLMSALSRWPKVNGPGVSVIRLPLFIRRLRRAAERCGAQFRFSTRFERLRYDEKGRIAGIFTGTGEEIAARLVVDASGIVAAVRRAVEDPFMETFETGPRDKFYVLLKYVELLEPGVVRHTTSWPYFKGWIAPQSDPRGAIIGVGASLSYDYARENMARFESYAPLPRYRLQREQAACTPYRRPPYSFVTDGFLAIGDAACLTKPMNGEGIAAAWTHCRPAAEVVVRAMEGGRYPTKEALWPVNTIYQRGEGADYAAIRAVLIGAVTMSPRENDFLFRESIVFKSDGERGGNDAARLLRGLAAGELSASSAKGLVAALAKGALLERHYRRYPDTPEGYRAWVRTADRLWAAAGSMADTVSPPPDA